MKVEHEGRRDRPHRGAGDGVAAQEILALSRASDWETAKLEWSLVSVTFVDEPETCLCEHFPIIEICSLVNRVTGERAEVGNVCVKRFLGIRSDLVFNALHRIRKDPEKSIGPDAALFFYERGGITEWEYEFCAATWRKRRLSQAQLDARRAINEKIIAAVQKRGVAAR